jgi:hypothetical protein
LVSSLGFWSTDAYAVKYQIVPPRSSGVQKITAAENFYDKATSDFDNRMAFILNHRNNLLGGKKWSELNDVVFAFEGAPIFHKIEISPKPDFSDQSSLNSSK